MEMDKDFYLSSAWLCDPVSGEALQAVLTDLEEITQNDIQIRSQIDIDSINNIFDDVYVILYFDKQKNIESIPLENVAEEEVIRIILAETRNQKVQRAFPQAGDVSHVAHRKLSPQSSLAQERQTLAKCERQYSITTCPTRKTYQELADRMNLPTRKIVIWFRNMLAKENILLRAEKRASSFSAQMRQISNTINVYGDVHSPSIRISGSSPQKHGKIITTKIAARNMLYQTLIMR
ncbi:hypothetical protein HN011_001097 [Eciton burchellii]|nr:hypothetical protein HN011_001097 [Eciton burchellii]